MASRIGGEGEDRALRSSEGARGRKCVEEGGYILEMEEKDAVLVTAAGIMGTVIVEAYSL